MIWINQSPSFLSTLHAAHAEEEDEVMVLELSFFLDEMAPRPGCEPGPVIFHIPRCGLQFQ